MASKPEPAPAAAESEAPKKGSKKLLIIIIAVVLLLGAAGGGAYFFLSGHSDEDEEEAVTQKTKSKKKSAKPELPVFVPLDPFTVNLAPEEGTPPFMRLAISMEVEDASIGDKIKVYTPKLRNNITLIISSKKSSELLTKEGKEKLAQEIRDTANAALDPGNKTNPPVKDVLFVEFIIQ